jgi:hypothetical protein
MCRSKRNIRLGLEAFEDRQLLSVTMGIAALAFSHSAEHYTQLVTDAYQQYMGRAPDGAGLANWVDQLQNHGLSDERLEAFFIGSAEYINNHGGSGAAWVEGMYRDLLGRAPDPEGRQTWLNELSSGRQTPLQVAFGFAASAEREGIVVQNDYHTFLGRAASPEEVNLWVQGFLAGTTNESVVAGFVGSPEYFANHLSSPGAWLTAAYKDVLNRAPDSGGYESWYLQLTGQHAAGTGYDAADELDQQVLAAAGPAESLTMVSALTAATDGAGHVREIALDANHRMWIHDGSGWQAGSTGILSVSTATNAQGNVDIFAVDLDHHAWFRILSQSGQLSNWYQLFPDDVGVNSLSAVTDSTNNLNFFITDTDNHPFMRTVDQYNNWSQWDDLNGSVAALSAVKNSLGQVELFALGSVTHHIFQRIIDVDGSRSDWVNMGGNAISVSAVLDSSGQVELFAVGGNSHNIFQAFETSPGQFSNWTNLGSEVANLSAVKNGQGQVQLFVVGNVSHNAFVNTEDAPGHWTGWINQTGVTQSHITDYTTLARQFAPHATTTIVYLNFDGGDVSYGNNVEHISPFVGHANMNRDQEVQNIVNLVQQIFAPFNVRVQRIVGAGNFDRGSNGNTTIFVGANSKDYQSDGRKIRNGFTPMMYEDAPGYFQGYTHRPDSEAYHLAFVDPLYQDSVGGTMQVEDDSLIAGAVAHETGHTFGLMHVLTGDGSGTYSAQNPPEIMSYDAPNRNFLNQVFNITDLNYHPDLGHNVHEGDHFYPQWNNNGTIETMTTEDSYTYLLAVLGAHGN